jgi:hypothetical protein
MTEKTNLAASISARLLNHARQSGADYQTLLTSYCVERFLYRLSVSDRGERFILKGAMLLRVWSDQPYRATRDLDLLRRGESDFEAIRDDLAHIVATPVPADAVAFQRRRTPIPQQSPVALTAEYWQSPTRPAQMRAFAKRAAIAIPDHFDQYCSQILQAFLTPLLDDLRTGVHVSGTWRPGGPWN